MVTAHGYTVLIQVRVQITCILYVEASDIVHITLSQVMDFHKTSLSQTRANLLAPM